MSTSKNYMFWGNINIDPDGSWEKSLQEEYPDLSDADIAMMMDESNNELLDSEREDLNIQLSQPILIIATLGLWHGRVPGYKEVPSGNIQDCLQFENSIDYAEWYVDSKGDLRANQCHHDGTHHLLYRVYKDTVSEQQRENLKQKILSRTVTRSDITRLTKRLGDYIGQVYGWQFPNYNHRGKKTA